MKYPVSTGAVGRLLRVPEPRLNDLVRRGKLDPVPQVNAGRRCWEPEHIRQAARYLGLLTEELEQMLQEETCHVP